MKVKMRIMKNRKMLRENDAKRESVENRGNNIVLGVLLVFL